MGKLKSSMKSLQEAITSLKVATGPNCIHQGITTESFREQGECSNSSFNYISSTPSFTSSSSSSLAAPPEDPLSLPKGPISSKRFFFSPRTTKSIMEESGAETGLLKIPPLRDPGAEKGGSWEESVTVAVASEDPYGDFKVSMEEMVEAHGIRGMERLQELLHCYLRLNERKNHRMIVLAFVGLLIDNAAKDREDRGSSLISATKEASCHDHHSDL